MLIIFFVLETIVHKEFTVAGKQPIPHTMMFYGNYRVRQKDIPYLERALCELWWGYGGGGGIDR
jgi:hypothetical protein